MDERTERQEPVLTPEECIFLAGGNPLKKFIKRIVLKLTGWMWRPAIGELTRRTEQASDRIRELETDLVEAKTAVRTWEAAEAHRTTDLERALTELDGRLGEALEEALAEGREAGRRMDERLAGQEARLEEALAEGRETGRRIDERLAGQATRLEEQAAALDIHQERLDKQRADLGATARQVMLAKWKIIDHLLPENESPEDVLTCGICGGSHPRSSYRTLETDCIFNGGHLVRYECPDCGAIFGPSKFVSQGQHGVDEDYWVHYLGFQEGDNYVKEERAFFMLRPEKGKVYLNYGCGRWSKSMQRLRDMGYNIYGYEPYATGLDEPYLITDRRELQKMRFDGIYSNDVLEHFVDPIGELAAMKELLLGPSGAMAHCTSCYIYKYEYTRFHTFFFTGRAVEIMAERAGLEIAEACDDMAEHDFICYVYKPRAYGDLLPGMMTTDKGELTGGTARLEPEGVLYGPYFLLPQGEYRVRAAVRGENMTLAVTADCGRRRFVETTLAEGDNELSFTIPEDSREVEFVFTAQECEGHVDGVWLERPVKDREENINAG